MPLYAVVWEGQGDLIFGVVAAPDEEEVRSIILAEYNCEQCRAEVEIKDVTELHYKNVTRCVLSRYVEQYL